jgi:hypothetical protein
MSNNYSFDIEFNRAARLLKGCLDMDLCLSEQVILRDITKRCITNLPKNPFSRWSYRPYVEASVQFMVQEYVSSQDIKIINSLVGHMPLSDSDKMDMCFLQSQRKMI